MSSPIPVYIDCPGWMQKYLCFVSENKKEPFRFQRKHDYNRLLINLVSNDRSIKDYDYVYNSGVKIFLPFNEIKDVYFYNRLSKESRQKFRKQIKQDLFFDFFQYTKTSVMRSEDRKKAVESFFNYIEISEDDLKYESFYRSFTRYLAKKRAKYVNLNIYSV